ncbi:MAG: YbaN family protein [Pseudomonadota bacterium]
MIHRRVFWFTIGAAAMVLAVLGVALPLLPTTPFLLVAAYAFAQSSQRCHDWLMRHRLFGPMIADWRAHRAISRRVKVVSLLSMVAIFALSVVAGAPGMVLVIQALVLSTSATFVATRPLPPQDKRHRQDT